MTLFHSHVQVISRSAGRSAVAAAAYRSGSRLTNERDGTTHDYSRKTGVLHSEVVLPTDAPARWHDRETLWNDVERSERSSNAQLAREIEYALPREFGIGQQVAFARAYAQPFADEGMVVDFSIHAGRDGNPHVHQMMTVRPCDGNGFTPKSVNEYLVRNGDGEERRATADELRALGDGWAKVYRYRNGENMTQAEAGAAGFHPTKDRRGKAPVQFTRYLVDWNDEGKAVEWRKRLADMQNEWLAEVGCDARVDHRSYADRGIDRIPTRHEGYAVRKAEMAAQARAGRLGREYRPVTQRRRENVMIKLLNRRFEKMMERAKRSYTELRRSMGAARRAQSANTRKRSAAKQRMGRRAHRPGGMSR